MVTLRDKPLASLSEGQQIQRSVTAIKTLVGRVDDHLALTAARIRGGQPDDAALAKAQDPAVRDADLRACQSIATYDGDGAQEENGVGWSQAMTHAGHWLAARSSLSLEEAAYELRLLLIHRQQLDDPLAAPCSSESMLLEFIPANDNRFREGVIAFLYDRMTFVVLEPVR